jgi:prolyl oligopeptidase PreP (S9A serine peptidase family)
VQVTINFNNATRAITNAVVWRAADCRWTKIVVGLGANGTPDTTTKVFDLSTLNDATRTVTAAQMAASPWFVTTVEQFMSAGQITAAL